MHKKLVISTIVCCSLISSLSFASEASPDQTETLRQLQTKVAALEKEIAQLQKASSVTHSSAHARSIKKTKTSASTINPSSNVVPVSPSDTISPILEESPKDFGHSMVIGPFSGKETTPDGLNLFINSVGVNKDLALLQMRNEETKEAAKNHLQIVQPRLIVGGKLEGAATYNRLYTGHKSTDIDLVGAEIDTLAELNSWANGFIALAYDNTADGGRRLNNSSVKLDKGFMTFGDLSKTGFYTTIGQMWVPFGRFSSYMINDPITKFIGKTKARTWVVGYAPVGGFEPYASAFLFKGDAQYQKGNAKVAKQYGADVGFNFTRGLWTGEMGISYLANIADADGMQNTGSDAPFKGFSGDDKTLQYRVGGTSIHGSVAYGNVGWIAEYVSALKAFDANDLTFNQQGAKPRAFYTEAYYNLNLFKVPSTIALAYGVTSQSLGLNLPRQRYSGILALYFTPNVQFKLEVDHSINYSKTDKATGKGKDAYEPNAWGHLFDAIIAQIGIYF